MADIPVDKIDNPPGAEFDNTFRRQWIMPSGATGAPSTLPRHADRSVQIDGVFDGALLRVEGTINGESWAMLTDPQGNALSFSSYPSGYTSLIEAISEAVVSVRPVTIGGGASTALRVTLLSRS